HVTDVEPGIEQGDVIDALLLAIHAAGRDLLLAPRRPDARLLESVSRAVIEESRRMTDAELEASAHAQHRVTGAVSQLFDGIDVLMTPVTAGLPLEHGTLDYD